MCAQQAITAFFSSYHVPQKATLLVNPRFTLSSQREEEGLTKESCSAWLCSILLNVGKKHKWQRKSEAWWKETLLRKGNKTKVLKQVYSYLCMASLKSQHCCENFSVTEKSAQIACWNQMYKSLEMTEFTLFLGCIYCAWISQSHFTAFHRNYINWHTESHQNLSSKNKKLYSIQVYYKILAAFSRNNS